MSEGNLTLALGPALDISRPAAGTATRTQPVIPDDGVTDQRPQ